MKAKSIRGKSAQDISLALQQYKAEDFTPTLAVAFISNFEERDTVRKLLATNNISLFGLSSNGEFIDDDYEGSSISILLMEVDPKYFCVELHQYHDNPIYDTAFQLGESAKNTFANPAFIISSCDTSIPSNELIDGLVASVGETATIIGGNAAAESLATGNHVFTTILVSHKAIIALIIDEDKIEVNGEAISGWKAVGTLKEVTESDGNWIKKIENKPALDTLLKYMGAEIDEGIADDLFDQVGRFYPLQVEQEDGDPVMRAPMFFNNDERSFMCAGPVPQGSMVRFSLPPDFDVGEDVVKSSMQMKTKTMPEAEALLVFSCLGRLNSLGPMVGNEIEGLRSTWDAPMIGFFTFGEYGRIKNGKTEFHNTTVSWVALKEK